MILAVRNNYLIFQPLNSIDRMELCKLVDSFQSSSISYHSAYDSEGFLMEVKIHVASNIPLNNNRKFRSNPNHVVTKRKPHGHTKHKQKQ